MKNILKAASAPERYRRIADEVDSAGEFLARHGVEFSRQTAESLLALVLGWPRWRIYLERDRNLDVAQVRLFQDLIHRRARREPLAYIEGEAAFYSVELKIDRRGFIPRPETELLVEESLKIINGKDRSSLRVLDLGCGSGNIALALGRESTGLEICASDISPEAVELARENARSLGLDSRVQFRVGDLFHPWEDFCRGFDLIVSNPPYVSREEFGALPEEVRLHEPRLALDGGGDGLEVIKRLIRESPLYLKPGGYLIFEIGAGQSSKVQKILIANGYFYPPKVIKDYNGYERVISVQRL